MVSEPNHVFDRCASFVSISQQCASVVDGGGRVFPSHNDRGMREVRVWPSQTLKWADIVSASNYVET